MQGFGSDVCRISDTPYNGIRHRLFFQGRGHRRLEGTRWQSPRSLDGLNQLLHRKRTLSAVSSLAIVWMLSTASGILLLKQVGNTMAVFRGIESVCNAVLSKKVGLQFPSYGLPMVSAKRSDLYLSLVRARGRSPDDPMH